VKLQHLFFIAGLMLGCSIGTASWHFGHHCQIPDSTFVTTNGTVSVVINGHRQTLAYEATNMVVRTRRGARITTEFKP
jgi:hypothetical protein